MHHSEYDMTLLNLAAGQSPANSLAEEGRDCKGGGFHGEAFVKCGSLHVCLVVD